MANASASKTAFPNIAPPEPQLTFAEMLRRAEALRAALRERQQQCEELGRMPEATHRDFLAAGFYRALQPRCLGGYEFSATQFVRLLMEISRGCIDSGWVLSLIASAPPTFLPPFSETAQREAYGTDGDCRIATVLKPGSSAIPVDGGYRVGGAWDYCSGCDVATHVMAMVAMRDSSAAPPKGIGFALFDREHYEVVDNWNMLGMQGTGSRRIVVAERILPAHRVVPMIGASLEPAEPRSTPNVNPALGGLAPAAVAVGAARGTLDLYEDVLRNKKWLAPPFPHRFEMPEMQQNFGTAQALVDSAEAAILNLADQSTERSRAASAGGVSFGSADVRRLIRAGTQSTELAWQAVELMFRTGGTSSGTKDAPLGRFFRGLAVMRTHVGLQAEHSAINVARLHFGLPALDPL